MASIVKLAEPRTTAELTHAVRLLIADQWPALLAGGGADSVHVELAKAGDVTISIESADDRIARERSTAMAAV